MFSYREKPWHGLGTIALMRYPAEEAFQMIGSYDVIDAPLHAYTVLEDGSEARILLEDKKAVLRLPTHDDPITRILGQIDAAKAVIPPAELCRIWDQATGRYVETLGGLGYGENFFISSKLQVFDVKGDEVEQYLLVHMDYRGKLQVSLVTIRVVCINTLTAAENSALEVHQINLATYPRQQLEIILQDLPARKEAESAALKEVLTIMRETPVTDLNQAAIIASAFPYPAPPVLTGVYDTDVEAQERSAKAYDLVNTNRQAVKDLIDGHEAGRGLSDMESSAYKVYNAVCELVDWGGNASKPEAFFKSVITGGHRANVKQRAWAASMQLINA